MYDRGVIMTEEERLEILNWFCENYFKMNIMLFGRVDYTLKSFDKSVPNAIWRIKKRIVEREGLQQYIQEPVFKDFLAAIMPGGRIHPHVDLNVGEFIHSRFNVFIQLPSNDLNTFYAGKIIDSKEGHYTLCRSGLDYHWTNVLNENRPRVSLSFGFLIPKDVLNVKYVSRPMKSLEEKRELVAPSAFDVEKIRISAAMNLGIKWWWSDSYAKNFHEQ